jgi:enamine deaminase RidA (YjgF/YER057c/UK114 family)
MKKELIVPQRMKSSYDRYHFAPAVKVGDTVWVSGQAGIRDNGEVPASLEEQTHLSFQKLKHVLESAGATLDDVVELVSYHVDFPNGAATIMAVKDQYMPHKYPAWTGLGVTSLLLPGLLIEIKAIAVIGCGR